MIFFNRTEEFRRFFCKRFLEIYADFSEEFRRFIVNLFDTSFLVKSLFLNY